MILFGIIVFAFIFLRITRSAEASPLTGPTFDIKPGVVVPDSAQAQQIINAVATVWKQYGYVPVITSGIDSEHIPTSLHYLGLAVDFRLHNIPEELRFEMIGAVRKILGASYQVIWEDRGTSNEHLHIEYDPGS